MGWEPTDLQLSIAISLGKYPDGPDCSTVALRLATVVALEGPTLRLQEDWICGSVYCNGWPIHHKPAQMVTRGGYCSMGSLTSQTVQ